MLFHEQIIVWDKNYHPETFFSVYTIIMDVYDDFDMIMPSSFSDIQLPPQNATISNLHDRFIFDLDVELSPVFLKRCVTEEEFSCLNEPMQFCLGDEDVSSTEQETNSLEHSAFLSTISGSMPYPKLPLSSNSAVENSNKDSSNGIGSASIAFLHFLIK